MRLERARGSNGGVLAVLVVSLVLLPLLVGGTLVQHGSRVSDEDRALSFEARRQVAKVADYFARSRSLTQILATNPAFPAFYETPGRRLQKIRGGDRSIRQTNEALAYLEKLFPGSIGEACFIDAAGAENARAVKGRIESVDKLSPDETGASFFAPTFALLPGQVYQSRPYVSPDTHEWVIANSAPIQVPGRATPAIVHFEITLESLRRAARAEQKYDIQIVDADTGRAVIDTRVPFVDARLADRLRVRALPRSAIVSAPSGLLTVAGYRVAYQRLPRVGENANDWIIVARSRTQLGGWFSGMGPWELLIFLGIVLLIPICFFSWRRSQKDLTRAASTDELTGLGNRRLLTTELDAAALTATVDRPVLLTMYDLDGFKHYNDSYGHPAGDALLARVALRLKTDLAAMSRAYRMGGDEFCVVSRLISVEQALEVAARSCEALSEHGDGFRVTASYGAVLLPLETSDPGEALRLADQRMYAHKSSSRLSVPRQTTDVLVQLIAERNRDLCEHSSEVAELVEGVSLRLGMSAQQIAEIKRAASLHDIGKLAIPESILGKREPLTEDESLFVRQHTIIGERILAAAPALSRCGEIVRGSHEAWDGTGYPDKLSGEEILLESRIIAVCDAFQAMIAERPYSAARTREEAISELQRCAGTLFDPHVVRAFIAELKERNESAENLGPRSRTRNGVVI